MQFRGCGARQAQLLDAAIFPVDAALPLRQVQIEYLGAKAAGRVFVRTRLGSGLAAEIKKAHQLAGGLFCCWLRKGPAKIKIRIRR
jgi:hypothetical protein